MLIVLENEKETGDEYELMVCRSGQGIHDSCN